MFDPENCDTNDPVKLTFKCSSDNEKWVNKKLDHLREYDEGFYYTYFEINDTLYYTIATKAKNVKHDEFKRFLFQMKMRVGDIKIL